VSTYRFIHAEEANHSIHRLCSALEVARSAYQAWKAKKTHQQSKTDAGAGVRVKSVFREHRGLYGAPRITAELRAQGERINRKRVARLMREQGLRAKQGRSFRGCTTDSNHDHPVAPNLLKRDFRAEAPNRAIVGDITYLSTQRGWVYLAVLIDLYSRKVIGWAIDDTLRTDLCLAALHRAQVSRPDLRGAIHHTDRGVQYTSTAYQSALQQAGMVPSMSRKGNCWDNAVAESFFGTLKQELLPERPWADLQAAKNAVSSYIHHYYNPIRRHSTLDYLSPVEFENHHQQAA
jgi:putative transposase